MIRNLFPRFTLSEEGSEGGSGGGGGITPPTPETGVPPLPSARARESIYDKADSAAGKGDTTPQPPSEPEKKEEGTPEGAATPEDSAQPPEDKGKKGKDLTPEQLADKRVKDAQAELTKQTMENAELKKAIAERDARLEMVARYVDMDKLTDYHQDQLKKAASEPITRKEFEERVNAAVADSATKTPEQKAEEQKRLEQEYMAAYVEKYPHMKEPIDDGLVYGVYLKKQQEMGPEATLDEIGDEVAKHFQKLEADREKKVAEKLTTKRSALAQGEAPKSGGTPRSGDDEGPEVDDPKTEFAARQARRNRTLTPRL